MGNINSSAIIIATLLAVARITWVPLRV